VVNAWKEQSDQAIKFKQSDCTTINPCANKQHFQSSTDTDGG